MFGVPDNMNLDAFLEKQIQTVHLGKYIFSLIFSDSLVISGAGQVVVTKDGVSTTIRGEEWGNLIPLTSIQGIPVIDYSIDSKKSFSLTLKDNTKITFTDNSEEYESFQVIIGNEYWVI